MKFEDCLRECVRNADFVREFNRLSGCELGVDKRQPIERMIDKATGHQRVLDEKQREYARRFVAFVMATVWIPLCDAKEAGVVA